MKKNFKKYIFFNSFLLICLKLNLALIDSIRWLFYNYKEKFLKVYLELYNSHKKYAISDAMVMNNMNNKLYSAQTLHKYGYDWH